MFLLTDALLILLDDVTNGLVVFPAIIKSQLEQEIPFIATENIIMKLVHKGVSRQAAHERIRELSRESIRNVKVDGGRNDLIERIKRDNFFVLIPTHFHDITNHCSQEAILPELDGLLDPKLFIGRSAEIVERYFATDGPVSKTLSKYEDYIASTATATLHVWISTQSAPSSLGELARVVMSPISLHDWSC